MSIQNLSALEEKNASVGHGIGSTRDDWEADDSMPTYMHAEPVAGRTQPEDAPSGLDLLRARTRERVAKRTVVEVPGRDGIALQMDAYIESAEMRDWSKASRLHKNRPASDDNVDGVLLGARAVAAKTTAILVDGAALTDPDTGDRLTFLDEAVRGMYEVRTPWDAAKALIGSDPGVLNVFQTLMEESGYANTAEVLDEGK